MFTRADFDLYQPRFQSDPEWNGRRLDVRRRLQELGERVQAAYAQLGIGLERRESIHNPHAVNQNRVRRQRTQLFRDRKARKALQSFLGKELGKDLDSSQNNAHLQAGLDADGVFWGLRIDPGAWYDLNSLLKRAEDEPGRAQILAACRGVSGFQLLVDGRGPRALEHMSSRDWRDLAGILQPGKSGLDVIRRLPPAAAEAAGAALEEQVMEDLLRLSGLFRLACWTLDGPCGASL
ncbi:MAG: hypothetical protein EYC70_07325 [Planctomycetota bacterium]|nr:MAG: hypothetical protein EYC70_07325 [Planctomycetota bacterium]